MNKLKILLYFVLLIPEMVISQIDSIPIYSIKKTLSDSFNLSECLVDSVDSKNQFAIEQLKELYSINIDSKQNHLYQLSCLFSNEANIPGFLLSYIVYKDTVAFKKDLTNLIKNRMKFEYFNYELPTYYEVGQHDNVLLIVYSEDNNVNVRVLKIVEKFNFKNILKSD